MKNVVVGFFTFLFIFTSQAQPPEQFKYQAIIRDANGHLLANQAVGIQLSILETSAAGSAVYVETHTITTSSLGLVNLSVGGGTVQLGSFASIDWSADAYFLEVAVDESGGSNYTKIGVSQLLSVPYALYAKQSGTSGVTGPTGPQGPMGLAGPAGITGATGPQGLPGPTGPFGSTGPQGAPGSSGPQGVRGATGPTGAQGIPGINGSQGPTGATGPAGTPGLRGATGPTGPQGLRGLQGTTGPTGPQGARGIQGIPGTNGSQGPTGERGLRGVTGPTGPQGLRGLQGIPGINGSQGPTGAAGPAGTPGLRGVTGPTGPQGARGIQGIPGTNGSQGPTGERGLRGVTGPTGPQGTRGARGLQGITGPTGTRGARGLQGATGPTGTRGARGLQGVTGPTGGTPRIAFEASASSSHLIANFAAPITLSFGTASVNDGGGYATTGVFTSNVKAVYMFTVHIRASAALSSDPDIYIYGGSGAGSRLKTIFSGDMAIGTHDYRATLIIELDVGETLSVRAENNFPPLASNTYTVLPGSTFSGFALYLK